MDNKMTELIINNIKQVNERVWIAGFSGGKDSSLLVDLLTETIFRFRRDVELHVIYADTLLEYPMVRNYAYQFLEELKRFSEKKSLNINVQVVTPLKHKDFIYLQLVRRYPMPHRNFRWCTDKLKILPAKQVIKEIVSSNRNKGVALFNGSRLDESNYRAKLMKKRVQSCKDCIDPVTGYSNKYYLKILKKSIGADFTNHLPLYVTKTSGFGVDIVVYSPLAYIKERNIWKILRKRRKPFFSEKELYNELLKLYGKHSSYPRAREKIRFGCWLCTVATKDKSGKYLLKIDQKVEVLIWARKTLFLISHGDNQLLRLPPRFNKQKYSGLNDIGLILTKAVYYIIYKKYTDALASYELYPKYQEVLKLIRDLDFEKTIKTINDVLNRTNNKYLKKLLRKMLQYLEEINNK